MQKNVGKMDRMARIGVAVILGALYFGGVVQGTVGLVALVAAVMMLGSALMSFCPLYTVLGVKTCGKGEGKAGKCCGGCGHHHHDEEKTEDKAE